MSLHQQMHVLKQQGYDKRERGWGDCLIVRAITDNGLVRCDESNIQLIIVIEWVIFWYFLS